MDRRSDERRERERFRSWWASGQSTLEYALVLMAFLAMLLGMGALWHAAREGRLVERARDAASHTTEGLVGVKTLQDLTAF